MNYSTSIKPISFLKTHASEVIREISANRGTMIITHNGEAKVIVQDVRLYEETQQSLAMLKILAQSSESIEQGRYKPASESFDLIRQQISRQQEL
jgi:hypothetical protein